MEKETLVEIASYFGLSIFEVASLVDNNTYKGIKLLVKLYALSKKYLDKKEAPGWYRKPNLGLHNVRPIALMKMKGPKGLRTLIKYWKTTTQA